MKSSVGSDRKAGEPRWFNSGRGIFKRDAGFQVGAAALTPNWQEDTAMLVDLLNKGEEHKRLREALTHALRGLGGCITDPPCGGCPYCNGKAVLDAAAK